MSATTIAPPDTVPETTVDVVTPAPPPVTRRRGGLFWHRDFRLLWIGRTTSTVGSAISGVAMPLVA